MGLASFGTSRLAVLAQVALQVWAEVASQVWAQAACGAWAVFLKRGRAKRAHLPYQCLDFRSKHTSFL